MPSSTAARAPSSPDVVEVDDEVDVQLTDAWADGGIPQLRPVQAEIQANVLERLRGALGASGLDETVCAVCDEWALRTKCCTINVEDSEQLSAMRRLLGGRDDDLSPALASAYDCSSLLPELEGMLLSKSGVDTTNRTMHVCKQCGDSLRKQQVPKLAIKNGFCIGVLPANMQQATLPERVMTQLVSVVAVTRVMRGGAHRAIRSHCLAFDATPGPPATLLPTPMRGVASYRVVLAGPFTTVQQAKIRKMHRVRRQVVEDLLGFYQAHNHLYEHVAVDCSRLIDDQVPEDILCEEPDADMEAEDVDVEGSRVGGVSDSDATVAEDEVLERRVVFVSDDREVAAGSEHAATGSHDGGVESSHATTVEPLTEASSAPQFLVRHSSRFSSRQNELFAQMFPHLFPHGRGHPGEARLVPVSLEACVRHYGMLSSRRFAEDELFMLAAFDHISLQKMYMQVALKCKRRPALFEPFSDVSEVDLADALHRKELRRQGRTAAPRGAQSTADRLLHSVELSGGAIWGSDAERAQCRRRAFAYQARYGQPAVFVTLTPNVGESFVMAQYTGVTSVSTLFDAELQGPPGKSVMQSASLRNDVVSARIFMLHTNAFVEHVLGVRLSGKPFDGLFGDVDAYFGMVETQGGGTLHAHFLIWLASAPPNSDAFDRAVATHGAQYLRDLEAYTDSIVSTSLPLDIGGSRCQFCGESYTQLEPLPIPAEAYASPDQRHGGPTAEPLLVECARCKTRTSSQHVLRRVILDNRPPLWPPPRRDHSVAELCEAVAREATSRGSEAAAKSAIFRRDCFLAGRDDDVDEEGDRLRALNRVPQRSERFHDDVFCSDSVARAVKTFPPSLDDGRWSSRALAFAVSVLVLLVNLHWWSHVRSCFKKTRSAGHAACRYGFPRPRVEQSTCTDEGVSVARRLASEYVNGFNAVMMAAFKSNHDIQVMIGGATALLRIYYATKYVTKLQAMIESVTAVALSAFRRRQARELVDQGASTDRASVGRRRVASLAFAVTNRREIAGPLAVLYLLRGSCCYKSSTCAPLPLNDILKELTDDDEHSCELVALHDNDSAAVYRAASLLDDYRYRPRALDCVDLYEFVMWYFRRKQSSSVHARSRFQPEHPLSSTHCVGKHLTAAVPVVTGVRMPYVDAESRSEMLLKRSRCALVLFHPFRAATDLVADPSSDAAWVDAYRRWEPTRPTFVCQIMANLDDFHRVEKQAQEATADEYDHLNVLDKDDDDDDATGTRQDVDAMADVGEAARQEDDQLGLLLEADCDNCIAGDELPVFLTSTRAGKPADAADKYRPLLTPAAEMAASAYASLRETHVQTSAAFSVDELNRYVEEHSTDASAPSEHYHQERPADVIELLSNALDPAAATWEPSDRRQQRPDVSHYATVTEVSRAFTLNERQHTAFAIVTSALLQTFLRQEQAGLEVSTAAGAPDSSSGRGHHDFEAQLQDQQVLMFLGGAGGTGKSRVIDAISAFCVSWHRESSLVKTALTGKAATLIGARTLASFLVRIEHAIQEKAITTLDALVIDEVSMLSKPDWLKLDKLLRRYKQVPGVPFGGVHIVLVGDFLQMPPVGADAIFVDPASKPRPSTADIEGFELWRRFSTVVVLEESVRFRSDPEWGQGCAKARVGEWTPAFMDIINSRVVHPSDADVEAELALHSSVFVTPENAKRLAINNAFVAQTATRLPSHAFPIRVIANFKGTLNQLSRSDVAFVLGLPDNRFGRMAPYLDLVPGMPVQVTQNVGTAKGVANGTLGTLESVHFPSQPPTTFRLVRDGETDTIVQLSSQPPDYALLRLPRPHAVPIRTGMDAELFPVFFATEPFKKSKISLPPAPDGQRRYLEVKLQQFPFVCAIGSTMYKVQGETLNAMVVVDWTSSNNLINKPQQSYLLVSRVTSRNAFYCLSPFTDKLAKWSRPPQNTLDEEARLNELSSRTLLAFQRSRRNDLPM